MTGKTPIHGEPVHQAMPADTPLVKNLEELDYLELLLHGKANFKELFADLEAASPQGVAEMQPDADRVPTGFQALIRTENLPEKILCSFQGIPKTT
ncbi:MAG: hypothetical protein V1816_12125 [Pseudomonadota bacterium]